MPITADDLDELFRLIESDPAFRGRLRALVGEVRPEAVQKSVEGVRERTEASLAELAGLQKRMRQTQEQIWDMVTADRGWMLEQRYRERAGAYFGRLVRGAELVDARTIQDALRSAVPPEALWDAVLIDLVVMGQPALRPDVPEVWIAVEVSSVIDGSDVARARRRAAHLSAAGRPVVPAVAGERARADALAEPGAPILVLTDGRAEGWEEALEAAVAAASRGQ